MCDTRLRLFAKDESEFFASYATAFYCLAEGTVKIARNVDKKSGPRAMPESRSVKSLSYT